MLLRWVVGECLRRRRLEQGRTLREVERGREEASSEVLAAICAALGMDLEDLVEAMRRTLQRWQHTGAVAGARDQVLLAA